MAWGALIGLVLLSEPGAEFDSAPDAEREHVLPERNDDLAARAQTWTQTDGFRVSPAVPATSLGSRVAAGFSVVVARTVALEARGVGTDASGACDEGVSAGSWVPLDTTFRGSEFRVAVVDLDAKYGCAQLRIRSEDQSAIGNLQWELLEPRYPDAGRASRSLAGSSDPLRAVAPELETLGVITREEWGARATACSATEDDWYRMAIHHTAGPQTANGTVIEQLQGTQAYGMDSGGFCDIPYQMLVGFDGTLYEGRALELMSGATGGGNNPGNLAVCFIGCYHAPDSDCVGGVGHDPTDAMMARGQLLVQTLVRLHDIATGDDNIRGHRDWPGNSTACPGSLLHPRLGELRADLTWFAGEVGDRSWQGDELAVNVGEDVEVWIELENTGGLAWEPGTTFLAPTPRDTDSPLAHASWPSSTRTATVDAAVEPGDVGRFTFSVSLTSAETVSQTFGLVHESITWFADEPWGGGPTDDAITITVRAVETGGDESGAGSSTGNGGDSNADSSSGDGDGDGGGEAGGTDAASGTTTTQGDGTGAGGTNALPQPSGESGGCGCHSGFGGSTWAGALMLGLLGLRRRESHG